MNLLNIKNMQERMFYFTHSNEQNNSQFRERRKYDYKT